MGGCSSTSTSSTEPTRARWTDIIRNLNNVLTTKRGYGYFLETFGLTDAAFRTTEEMVIVLSREIKENVRLYEPRVELIEIDEEYSDGQRPRLIVKLAGSASGRRSSGSSPTSPTGASTSAPSPPRSGP